MRLLEKIIQLWNRPSLRQFLFQAIVLSLLVSLIYVATDNAISHLEKQNIASGFGFLSETAGFGIHQTLIPYSETSTYGEALLVGLLNTLLVAILGIIAATFLGFVIGIARVSQNPFIAYIATFYIEIIRNIPLLLQIFFWYFAVFSHFPHPRASLAPIDGFFINSRGIFIPEVLFDSAMIWVGLVFALGVIGTVILSQMKNAQIEESGSATPIWPWVIFLLGICPLTAFLIFGQPAHLSFPVLTGFNFEGGLRINREFFALFLALSTYTAAFIAEIIRAGILSVKRGQIEAGRSLGLPRAKILRQIIIPQAMRVIIPPLTSQYLNLTKNSSLAVAIAYPDLVSVFAGTVLNQTGQAVEIILITMLVYLALSIFAAVVMNFYNRHLLRQGAF